MKTFWLKFEMEEEIAEPDLMDLTDDFPGVVEGVRVDSITLHTEEPLLGLDKASYAFLSTGKDEIFELFERIREDFDESEYQQGKKDGLRSALALLGNPVMESFNRGGRWARERLMKSYPITMYELERDPHEGAIVLRREVFEDREAWSITRDVPAYALSFLPKESDKNGLFFFCSIDWGDGWTPYLWDTPKEAFAWWEANRDKIVAFTSDRLRLEEG